MVAGADPSAGVADGRREPDGGGRRAGGRRDEPQGGDRGGGEAGRGAQAAGLQPGARRMTRLLRYRNDGLVFDVRDTGPLDGDPVVLLHGFPERAATWRKVEPLLHAHGLRTYAPDQRGYSPGARPRRRRDYRIQRLVGDVVALAEAIGRPVHLVGHDWGAAVGWYVAQQRPDLVRTWTAVSVPHPMAFARAALTSRQLLHSWYMLAFQLPRLPERGAVAAGRAGRHARRAGMTRRGRRALPHRDGRGGRAARRDRLVPRAPAPRPPAHPRQGPGADHDGVERRRRVRRPQGRRADAAVRRRRLPPGRAGGRHPLDPHPGPRGAGRGGPREDRTA